jgi:hypothetical protein
MGSSCLIFHFNRLPPLLCSPIVLQTEFPLGFNPRFLSSFLLIGEEKGRRIKEIEEEVE